MLSNEPLGLFGALFLLAAVAGVAVVAGGFWLCYRQLREMTRRGAEIAESLRIRVYGAAGQQMLTVDSLFLNHPELRPYFYSGQVLSADDPLYPRALAMAELVLDYFNSVMRQMRHFPEMWPRVWWESYLIDSFKNSPLLCEYLRSVGEWYSPDLAVLMKRGERKRQAAEPAAALIGS